MQAKPCAWMSEAINAIKFFDAASAVHPAIDPPKVVTAVEAARLVGLSASTLAKLRLNGNGPAYCKWAGGLCIARPTWRVAPVPDYARYVRCRRAVLEGVDDRAPALSDGIPPPQS